MVLSELIIIFRYQFKTLLVMTRVQTIDLLRSQLPGFYSVEQVINLIEKMDDAPRVTLEMLKTIEDDIISRLEEYDARGVLVDENDIQLELGHNGRTIEIGKVTVNMEFIRDAIAEKLQEAFLEDEE